MGTGVVVGLVIAGIGAVAIVVAVSSRRSVPGQLSHNRPASGHRDLDDGRGVAQDPAEPGSEDQFGVDGDAAPAQTASAHDGAR